ncbi:MAG: hypothetical protein VR70_04005 [Rhodospirillaceae bacterium BRH_c57]|nr:MAG: hypothetical protein VR70_04005 [Rhodospirillaceae bacterium BRH_c57]
MIGETTRLPPAFVRTGEKGARLMPKGKGSDAVGKLEEGIDGWLVGIAAREAEWEETGERPRPVLTVMDSDVGMGKSYTAALKIAATVRSIPECYTERKKGKGGSAQEIKGHARVPFVVTTPSHALSHQFADDISKSHPEVDLGYYEGKMRAGCLRPADLGDLAQAGISSHNLCEAWSDEEDDSGGKVKVLNRCQHYFQCPVQKMRAMFNRDPFGRGIWKDGYLHHDLADKFEGGISEYPDILFTVHAMASIQAHPDLVKRPRAVVVDESVTANLLNEGVFPLSTLSSPSRETVRLTKAERAKGLSPEGLMADYAALAKLAAAALMKANARKDVCAVESLVDEWMLGCARVECRRRNRFDTDAPKLAADKLFRKTALETLKDALKLAKRIAWQAATSEAKYGPDSTSEEIKELCSQPKSKEAVLEWRFWKIIEERIELVYESEDWPARAKEVRIALSDDKVEVSWRGEFTWQHADILMLDASVSLDLLACCFPHHDIEYVDATLYGVGEEMPQFVHAHPGMSMSNTSLVPPASASTEAFDKAARAVFTLKNCIDSLVLMHPYGQVLIASSKKVEENVLNNYTLAANSSTALRDLGLYTPATWQERRLEIEHYGNLRGKNNYKFAEAVILVGKMEPPEDSIRRLARAAYYDQPEQADDERAPADGDWSNPKCAEKIRLRMRDGTFMETVQWTYRNKYERAIHKSLREEELIQAAGRARAAQRDPLDTSTWPHIHIIGNVFPDKFVYDTFVHVNDLSRGAALFDAACANGGVLWPEAVIDTGLAVCAGGDADRRRKTGSDWLTRRGFTKDTVPPGWAKVDVRTNCGRPTGCFVWLPSLTDGETPESKAEASMRKAGKDILSVRLILSTPVPERVVADMSATRLSVEERDAARLAAMDEARDIVRREQGGIEDIGESGFNALCRFAIERVMLCRKVGLPEISAGEIPTPPDPEDVESQIPF